MAAQYTTKWKDYYAILKLPCGCEDVARIRANYKRLMQLVHPDVNPELGETEAKNLNEAHDCLIDPIQRATYWRYYQHRRAEVKKRKHNDPMRRQWEEATKRAEEARQAYEQAEERIREEQQWKEEAEQQAEQQQKRVMRKIKLILLAFVALLLISGVYYIFDQAQAPRRYYQRAEEMLAAGDYDSAASFFRSAGDYLDAQERSEQVPFIRNISRAETLLENLRLDGYVISSGYTLSGGYGWSVAVADGYIEFAGYPWRILEIDTIGSRALLITTEVLSLAQFDSRSHHSDSDDWSTSTLRVYLNSGFYQTLAENDRERVLYQRSQNWSTVGDIAVRRYETTDFVFLLSEQEASAHFSDENDRAANISGGGRTTWWLRSVTYDTLSALYVSDNGEIILNGEPYASSRGVRPAIWISLG